MKETAIQIYERYMSAAGGGIQTDEQRWGKARIFDTMDTHRGLAIQALWIKGNKMFNPLWLQDYKPEYSEYLQEESCYVIFECPPFISLDSIHDGLFSVGNNMTRIPRVRTLNELRTFKNNKITKNTTMCIWQEGQIKVYGQALMLEEIEFNGMWLQPTRLPTFNETIDYYPACQTILGEMLNMWKEDLKTLGVLDYVPDGNEPIQK